MHAVVETPDFLADAKQAGLSAGDRERIITYLMTNPDAGDSIPGTGGARKVRFAGQGKGKSGGYRVITFFSGRDVPLFLLNVFAKGQRVNLSQAECNTLRKELALLVSDYLEGVRDHVESRRAHPAQRS